MRWLARLLTLLVVGCWPSDACGPFYSDGHRGADDPLIVSLEDFYLGLYDQIPRDPLSARKLALAAEEAQRFDDARTAWREVAAHAGGNRDAVDLGREARVHIALLPHVGKDVPLALWQLYASVRNDDALTTATGDLLAAVLLRQAEERLRAGATIEGLRILERAHQAAASPELQIECDLLASAAPALAGISTHGVITEPAAAVARLQRWLDGHPQDSRRTEALGWQAFVIYHQPECAADGLAAAVRIYQGMLDDPVQRAACARPAIESLRYLYRKFRDHPPAGMVTDARHAIAFTWFAMHEGTALGPEILGIVRDGVLRADPATLAPEVLERLAQVWASTSDTATALNLARSAHQRSATAATTYLLVRALLASDLPKEATPLVESLITANDPKAVDVLMRLGSAWGRIGQWREALLAYARSGSQVDVDICSDGEIPLDDFITFMATTRMLVPIVRSDAPDGVDMIPRLRGRLAIRLARADRFADALTWSDDARRAHLSTLMLLQAAVSQATPAERPSRLHALARYWYDQGSSLVFNEGTWQQWAVHTWWPFPNADEKDPLIIAGRERYRVMIEGMTTYHRAFPLFMEVAERFPESADAPACLYAAALCRYWLCGQTYLHDSLYWKRRSKDEDYARQGDDLLRRLARQYPDHPLAGDLKVVRAVSGGGLRGQN